MADLEVDDVVLVGAFGTRKRGTVLRVEDGDVTVKLDGGRRIVVPASKVSKETRTPLLPPPMPGMSLADAYLGLRGVAFLGSSARDTIPASTPPVFAREPRPVPKPDAPLRSETFMEWVRDMPCCSCQAPPRSDPNHVGPRGLGQKTDDFRCVPNCRRCHDHFHAHNRFPNMDKATTRLVILQTQVDLLVRWIRKGKSR